jgi:uncharacterized SAM-binding protein YcdF (DUF218 family)
VGLRAPVWLIRLCGALVGLAIVQFADELGVWMSTGASLHVMRLAFAVLGAALATSSLGSWLWLLLGAEVTFFAVAVYTPLVARQATRFVRADVPGPADAILVFSGSVNSAGRVHDAALERLLSALQLARQRQIGALGLSVVADEHDARTPGSERDQRELVALALPGLEPRFVRDVHSTRDEALAFAALARTHGWKRVVAITSPTHTRRACSALEVAGLSVECRPATEREYDLGRLDRPGNRRLATQDAVYEAAATVLYRARGWMR